VLWTSAGTGEERKLGEITEQHFDATFGLNARGTLFTVQKALPLFNDGGSIFMTGSIASVKGFPFWSVYAATVTTKQGPLAGALHRATDDRSSSGLALALTDILSGAGSSKTSLVELRGLEPLTPTLPVWCATNCAIAP
jgi:hypothetical protein